MNCLKKSEIIDINNSEVSISTKNKTKISYKISVSSKIMIFNSLIIAAALDLLTNDLNLGLIELSKIENIAGRGKAFDISFDQKTITIIDDSYNASLPSMLAGFKYATELKNAFGKNRVIAAIGDMLELGEKSVELHNEIAKYLNELKIDFVVAVGQRMTEMTKNLSNPYKVFSDSTSASLEIQNLLQDGDILYVKGSRGTKMEKIIEKLTNKTSVH
jgi:UDP-N-acetylmuramoyl-tripeptide--D-alanyl-D-alanine ligase